jgi:hypothetical protein
MPLRPLKAEAFFAWVKRYGVDGIVSNGEGLWHVLKGAGILGIPCDLIARRFSNSELPGMVPQHEFLGSRAVDIIATALMHGETGIPKVPVSVTVPGVWQEGDGEQIFSPGD